VVLFGLRTPIDVPGTMNGGAVSPEAADDVDLVPDVRPELPSDA
jgi:hypothetical protein